MSDDHDDDDPLFKLTTGEFWRRLDERLAKAGAGQPRPLLVDKQVLSKLVDLCPATIDNLRKDGLPTVKVLGSVRFEPAAVLAWIKERGS